MSDDRRDAAEASAVDVECEPMTLRLVLSDLTMVETFRGFYEYGDRDMEVEPAHRVMIKAKWKNVWYEYGRSDQRFLLGGKEIDPEMTPLLLGGRRPARTMRRGAKRATAVSMSTSSRASSRRSWTRSGAGRWKRRRWTCGPSRGRTRRGGGTASCSATSRSRTGGAWIGSRWRGCQGSKCGCFT
jgi:hypothetical protein